jgi:D-glycero-alpha-D-manno-heptose 1-phosphate guanylyltransferase
LSCYVDWFFQIDRKASLLLVKVPDTSRYGLVKVEKDESVSVFEEKGKVQGSGWINAGAYILEKSLLKKIPEGKMFSLERQFFPKLVGNGIYGYCSHGEFIDIGIPETYLKAEQFISSS